MLLLEEVLTLGIKLLRVGLSAGLFELFFGAVLPGVFPVLLKRLLLLVAA